jgi:signal transduction histidine kinase
MKNNKSIRYSILIKIVTLFILGFLLISGAVWIFFRNSVRNIGRYLYFGKPDNAVLLITTYLGDPPSKIKAKVLTRMYNISIVYSEEGNIVWATEATERADGPRSRAMGNMMRGMRHMDIRRDIPLDRGRVLSLYIPMHLTRKQYFTPFIFFILVAVLIGFTISLSVKKTLKPLDRIMEASRSISNGDLSYRIQYNRDDDFGKVASAFNTMAEKLSSMLSNHRELLHLISHELRTPLTRINLALEIQDKEKSAELIKGEIKEIDTLVGEVLDLSRMDYEDRIKDSDTLDLVDMLKGLINKYNRKEIRFDTTVETADISGNEVLLKKAFSNLIDNAVNYSASDTVINIGIIKNGGNYITTVENSGPGLSEKEQVKIWEPFYRGDNSQLNGTPGKGLGLVIVKKAIRLSDGKITVASSSEGPTIFTVSLPEKITKMP